MSYLRDRPSCNVHPQNAYKSLCVCACLSPVTSGLSLVKFDISILPVQDISDCLFYGECEIWGCHKCVAEDPDRVGSDVVSIGRVVLGVWMGIICATWPQRSCRKWHHVIGQVVLGVWMGIVCATWPQRSCLEVTPCHWASSSWCLNGNHLRYLTSKMSQCCCCGIILQKGWIFSIAFV
jgi:hypothetical protein